MAYTLPDLPYAPDALEPHIDGQTMEIHHGKHHNAYVTKLNAALEGHDDLLAKSVEDLISDLDAVPEAARTAVRNNGGGHANHSMWWTILSASGGGEPVGELGEKITATFGGYDGFKEKFKAASTGQFGSGWGWLSLDGDTLVVEGLPNQDSPLMHGRKPIIGLDVWEHAYYLKYQNKRPDYVDAFWGVVDWNAANERYLAAKG